MRLRLEALDLARKNVFQKLSFFKKRGYLAGGTALALQIKHRISYDFDIFCDEKISDKLLREARQIFSIKKILVNSKDEFTFTTKNDIKISFIYYPFKLDKFVLRSKESIDLLSSKGIVIAKAYTLGRRASWRDYVDLYFTLKGREAKFDYVISQAKKIYGELFSEKLFLAQLVYTKDVDKKEISGIKFLGKKVALKEVEKFFQSEVNKYWQGRR